MQTQPKALMPQVNKERFTQSPTTGFSYLTSSAWNPAPLLQGQRGCAKKETGCSGICITAVSTPAGKELQTPTHCCLTTTADCLPAPGPPLQAVHCSSSTRLPHAQQPRRGAWNNMRCQRCHLRCSCPHRSKQKRHVPSLRLWLCATRHWAGSVQSAKTYLSINMSITAFSLPRQANLAAHKLYLHFLEGPLSSSRAAGAASVRDCCSNTAP